MVDLDDPEQVAKFYVELHGIEMCCPTCSARGKLDTLSEEEAEFKESIWWSVISEQWECSACWLK